jgi:hypothetical protein
MGYEKKKVSESLEKTSRDNSAVYKNNIRNNGETVNGNFLTGQK